MGHERSGVSKEEHCPEHVCGVRDSVLFDRRREQSAGVVNAARLLIVQSRYFARGSTESRRLVPRNCTAGLALR